MEEKIKKDTVLYQICVEGTYKCFSQTGKMHSKHIFLNPPTQKDIDEFIQICCNSEDSAQSMFDLDIETVKAHINELIVT